MEGNPKTHEYDALDKFNKSIRPYLYLLRCKLRLKMKWHSFYSFVLLLILVTVLA